MTTTTNERPALTVESLRRFSHNATFLSCVRALLLAQTFAQIERERVDAYIQPLFEEFEFTVSEKMRSLGGEFGEKITARKLLYLASDEQTTPFYRACDAEHRKHGFNGPDGHCPALRAEHLETIAENNLLEYATPALLGRPEDDWNLYGDARGKALDLFISMGVKAGNITAATLMRRVQA